MAIINVENLVKEYSKGKKALDNISFSLDEGKIYGLLGPNGAGKSTLIHILIGLLKPTSGKSQILGADSGDISKYSQFLGFVPQNIAVFDKLTAYENVEFFGGLYGLKGKKLKEKCEEVLEFVGLLEHKKTLSSKFSGGMNRRLNIACALLNDPKLIILDEPTVGIDPQSRNYILESIKDLNKKGSTVIYTSHYMEEVEKLCDYIYIMDSGSIISHGKKEDLLKSNDTNGNYSVNIDQNYYEKASEIYGSNFNNGIITFSNRDINSIIDELRKYEIGFTDISSLHINLEELFLKLTGKKLRD